jgi:hypothetical protein
MVMNMATIVNDADNRGEDHDDHHNMADDRNNDADEKCGRGRRWGSTPVRLSVWTRPLSDQVYSVEGADVII